MATKKFTAKQKLFVDEYLIDKNATQAAIRAGYSKKTAEKIGSENLHKPEIAKAINAALDAQSVRTQIDADYVLKQSQKLHERCMQEIDPVTDREGNQVCDDETGRPMFTFNANGAAKGLELIGKHIKVQAFKENIDIQASDKVTRLLRGRDDNAK